MEVVFFTKQGGVSNNLIKPMLVMMMKLLKQKEYGEVVMIHMRSRHGGQMILIKEFVQPVICTMAMILVIIINVRQIVNVFLSPF